MARVFISYKRVNKEIVYPLKDKIEAAIGESCWIDIEGTESDSQFVNVIVHAIDAADIFLFMYSHNHELITNFENDWTIRELNYAQEEKKRIVLVNIDNAHWHKWFKFMFPHKQQIDATNPEEFEKLLKDLQEWLGITIPTPQPKPEPKPFIEDNRDQENQDDARLTEAQKEFQKAVISPNDKHDVFISYSRKDIDTVKLFCQQMDNLDIPYWLDITDEHTGINFKEAIVDAIDSSKIVLFFSSKDSNQSPFVVKEIGLAVSAQKHIIPIRIDDTQYAKSIRFDLSDIDWIEYNPDRTEKVMQKFRYCLQLFLK